MDGDAFVPPTENASPPTKLKTSSLSYTGYDNAHQTAAIEQCTAVPPQETVNCNERCCPQAHVCSSEFQCAFEQHQTGEYAIKVKHQYDSPNQVHKCHLLEDGFGGSECVCECFNKEDGNDHKPEQPRLPTRRLIEDENLENALGL